MEKIVVERYKCSLCGKLFDDEASCLHHEKVVCTRKERWKEINEKWAKGLTLGEINDEFHIIKKLPEEIRCATRTTKFRCLNQERKETHRIDDLGTIERFVSSHVVFKSTNLKFERRRSYSDFQYMSVITK